jgi:hypothetical protein
MGFFSDVKSQVITYTYIDSISYRQYFEGDWDNLQRTGKIAKKANIDFPLLHMRLGYAAMLKDNHALSLKHYLKVLQHNSYNENAIYYACYNNMMLQRRDLASFLAKKLTTDSKTKLGINNKKLIENFNIESSMKPTNSEFRKIGQYFRIGVASRVNYRWKLHQSFASYRQNMVAEDSIRTRGPGGVPRMVPSLRTFLVNDFQYYLKSEVFINANLSIINALHYNKTHFDQSNFNTAIFNCGLKLTHWYADYKLEINTGPLLDSFLTQFAVSSTYYPLGNLKFYGNSRLSYQSRTNLKQWNYSQMIGIKLHQKVWVETHATLGQIKNLIDNESLYIYDALDAGKYRIGATLLIPFTLKFSLITNYYFEPKKLYLQNNNYNLNSFSITMSWKL